ncbi:NAD-dependent epimerase/dehydratase family protein [Nitrincola sp. MINF-07-Sa-05]|uniref:NAD-dependent epimerase/dehydratase family protein n=1 Tax=Nitrincola salilacus TaxID=3400273 RepID=UPI003917FEC5
MKRVVVLGASSMLGREVVRQLKSYEIEVIQAGRSADMDIIVSHGSGKSPIFSIQCNADVLIHCTAAFGNDDLEGIRLNIAVNIGSAVDVIEIATKMSINRIVYAGSLSSDPSCEPDKAMSSYGMSKLNCENILNWSTIRRGGSFCSLRLTQLLDTDGDCCRHQPWFGRIVAYASQGLTLRIPASNGTRNFLHISDAARILIAAANSDFSGYIPIIHPINIDLHTLAIEAFTIFGQGGEVVVDPKKTPFRMITFPHDTSMRDILGIKPQLSTVEVLHMIRDAGTACRFGPLDVQ